jgi:hypothetical protein
VQTAALKKSGRIKTGAATSRATKAFARLAASTVVEDLPWEPGRQKASGLRLQKQLRGPAIRRFLAVGTTMGRRNDDCCPYSHLTSFAL